MTSRAEQKMPALTIITGPSGAGKSTLARELAEAEGIRFLDPDRDRKVSRETAYLSRKAEAKLLIQRGESFGFDNVFGTDGVEDIIMNARRAGYHIRAHIVSVRNARECVRRVEERASKGGHWHPPEAVFQLYEDALAVAQQIIPIAQECFLYDNTKKKRRGIAMIQDMKIKWQSGKIPHWAEPFLEGLERPKQRILRRRTAGLEM